LEKLERTLGTDAVFMVLNSRDGDGDGDGDGGWN
jgi:hypothetical protein